MFLLDTNVVSELRKPKPHGQVVRWIRTLEEEQIFLSAVSIGEIQRGIEITRRNDPTRANQLQDWLLDVESAWNILPVDAACFRIWARQMHRRPEALALDGMIAATAISNGLRVATRNVKDFVHFDVEVVNPFDPAGIA